MTAPLIDPSFPVILAGPSGAGKTTMRERLLADPEAAPRMTFSVSMTTRDPRPGEREGVDYRFVTREVFERRAREGALLEHAEVHGERYGTPRANLDEARGAGRHLLLDIDVQGARQVRRLVPETVAIFVLPPAGGRIRERLRRRGSETPEQLRRRLDSARAELAAIHWFDYVVVNDDLEAAVRAVSGIVTAEERAIRRLGGRAEARAAQLEDEITGAST
ncbi:MAG: guanylate kinase [Gemmatimonadota bacterium]